MIHFFIDSASEAILLWARSAAPSKPPCQWTTLHPTPHTLNRGYNKTLPVYTDTRYVGISLYTTFLFLILANEPVLKTNQFFFWWIYCCFPSCFLFYSRNSFTKAAAFCIKRIKNSIFFRILLNHLLSIA